MYISVLMDDTVSTSQYVCEHGLSFFVETQSNRVLFDAGASALLLENATRMGISLAEADFAILSHGHIDHGGGMKAFLTHNLTAKVYLQANALEEHRTCRANGALEYIGLPTELLNEPRLVPFTGDLRLNENLLLFSTVTGQEFLSNSNKTHLVYRSGRNMSDVFDHEQSLLVWEGPKLVLIAGCSHRGIVNIMNRAMELSGRPMDAVVGGFHLSNPRDGGCEPMETIQGIANYLRRFPTRYYTCHCTGSAAFQILHQSMGEQLQWVGAGSKIQV